MRGSTQIREYHGKISISSWMLVTGTVYSGFVITAVMMVWQHLLGKCVREPGVLIQAMENFSIELCK